MLNTAQSCLCPALEVLNYSTRQQHGGYSAQSRGSHLRAAGSRSRSSRRLGPGRRRGGPGLAGHPLPASSAAPSLPPAAPAPPSRRTKLCAQLRRYAPCPPHRVTRARPPRQRHPRRAGTPAPAQGGSAVGWGWHGRLPPRRARGRLRAAPRLAPRLSAAASYLQPTPLPAVPFIFLLLRRRRGARPFPTLPFPALPLLGAESARADTAPGAQPPALCAQRQPSAAAAPVPCSHRATAFPLIAGRGAPAPGSPPPRPGAGGGARWVPPPPCPAAPVPSGRQQLLLGRPAPA